MSDAAAQPAQARLSIVSQFIRSLSFDNVAAKELRNPTGRPNINVEVRSEAQALESDQHLVSLNFVIKATGEDGSVYFTTNLEFCGVARLSGFPEDQIQPVLHVECPQLLFPFARRVIAEATREGGFPPLMLDPINFVQLYAQQRAAAMAGDQGSTPSENV